MLLNSLFCIYGRDSNLRFIAVSAACYLVILLWMLIFGGNTSTFIPAIVAGVILLLSGYRRTRDAQKPQWWCVTLLVPWLALALSISFDASSSIWLSISLLGFVASLLFTFPKSLSVGRFASGYQGPAMKVGSNQAASSKRVEPSLNAHSYADETTSFVSQETTSDNFVDDMLDREPVEQASITAQLNDVIESSPFSKKTILLVMVTGFSIVILALLGRSLWISGTSETTSDTRLEIAEQSDNISEVKVRFTDGFTLGLAGKKLSMSWLGDEGDAKALWTLADAKGELNCQVLRFNNGTKYRTMKVERLGDSSTQAWFTPLDTKAILKDVARRNNASLCGYTFSLKGSQSDLSKEPQFRAYIE
ncbi:MAG: hypothetical protein HAW66_10055 [Shewanella sp.]|nr:hypothetical protein [Shewanella sp.]